MNDIYDDSDCGVWEPYVRCDTCGKKVRIYSEYGEFGKEIFCEGHECAIEKDYESDVVYELLSDLTYVYRGKHIPPSWLVDFIIERGGKL